MLRAETDDYATRDSQEKQTYLTLKRAMKEARILRQNVQSIIKDFKDGSLVRTRPTTTKLEKNFQHDPPSIDDVNDEANFLDFPEAVAEHDLGTSRLSESMRAVSKAEVTITDVGRYTDKRIT